MATLVRNLKIQIKIVFYETVFMVSMTSLICNFSLFYRPLFN
uniref:Uncharacterized protein n=1 Tax=Arundo donax TaxID=35708 RepID=A0A0A8ZU75_ARUDO